MATKGTHKVTWAMSRVQNPRGRDAAMNRTKSEMPITMSGDIIMTKSDVWMTLRDGNRQRCKAMAMRGSEQVEMVADTAAMSSECTAASMSPALPRSLPYQSRSPSRPWRNGTR